MNKFVLFFLSFLIRIVFIIIAEVFDRNSPDAKYTDIDYSVFSDAATYVYKGGSPYQRHTYRYTPLVAYICLVNNYIHPLAAKFVWSIADIIVGVYMWRVLDIINDKNKASNWKYVAYWQFHPLIFHLSSRGSNDNTIAMFVFITFYYVLRRQYILGGIFYGISVHFKIYPIVYSVIFYFFIDADVKLIEQGRRWEAFKKNFFTKNRLIFTFVSAGTFLGLTYYFYTVYGYEFLYETYLYHFVRKDNRHNFSVYWYMIYQLYDEPSSTLIAILTFVPQWTLIILSGLLFFYDIFFAAFVQTMVFVTFNKVITSQYYLWYNTLVPMTILYSDLRHKKLIAFLLFAVYNLGQFPFGYFAYRFEFMGLHTFSEIQYVNYMWFCINVFVLLMMIKYQRLTVTKQVDYDKVEEKSKAEVKDDGKKKKE
eukprot:403360062